MKLLGPDTHAAIVILEAEDDEAELLELDELLALLDALEFELLVLELELDVVLLAELDAELVIAEDELIALELSVLLIDDAVDINDELLLAPTADELDEASWDPLHAVSIAASITHDDVRMAIENELMASIIAGSSFDT